MTLESHSESLASISLRNERTFTALITALANCGYFKAREVQTQTGQWRFAWSLDFVA